MFVSSSAKGGTFAYSQSGIQLWLVTGYAVSVTLSYDEYDQRLYRKKPTNANSIEALKSPITDTLTSYYILS